MSTEQTVYRRVLRRETHASRTGAATTIAVIATVVLVLTVVVGVWMLADPGFDEIVRNGARTLTTTPDARAVSLVVGVAGSLLGLLLVWFALAPGARARHARTDERFGLLVDDGIIADAAADAIADRCGIDRERVVVTVGRRTTRVEATPTSGVPFDADAASDAATRASASLGFRTTARTHVAERGVVA